MKTKNGRKVVDIHVGGSHDDLQLIEAFYEDNGEVLNDEDLDFIESNYHEELYENWLNKMIDSAESYAERDR